MEARMQEWEYLQVHFVDNSFDILSANGQYFADEDYKAIDSHGKRNRGHWEVGMDTKTFLLKILDKLGSEGWEAIGNVAGGYYRDVSLLLKRPKIRL